MTDTKTEVFQNLDIPATAPRETAEAILEDVKNGKSVTLEIEPTDNLVNQIEWQLENDRPVTKLVDDYTERSE